MDCFTIPTPPPGSTVFRRRYSMAAAIVALLGSIDGEIYARFEARR